MSVAADIHLLDCATYEDYLDTFILKEDVRFIRKIKFCRMISELGYRSKRNIYTPEQFEIRKATVQESVWPTKKATILFSVVLVSNDPVLQELANREKANNQKILSTIIFIKHRLKSGFEITGYIDLEESFHRANLRYEGSTDWTGVFQEKVLLRPKKHDLSYFDWHNNIVSYNNSRNYKILHDVELGLIFMHKGDHKKICVDSSCKQYKNNCIRSMVYSPTYGHVIFYDHVVRKKI